MLNIKWEKKAAKYKSKYLALKKQLGGFIPEPEFMTSRIDPVTDFYLSQNLFSYWISSSHNTYLPYDQNTDPVNICYYRLQSMVYSGGCVEIDTYGIEDGDVIISHMITNRSNIKLGDILDIIMDALNSKIKRGIISGPFILNFDNSSLSNSLRKKSEQEIFWQTINKKLLSGPKVDDYKKLIQSNDNPVLRIDNSFDLSRIPIKAMSNKILFRWGLNDNCEKEDVGNNLCPHTEITGKISTNSNQWVHLNKSKMGFIKQYVDSRNMSQSTSSPFQSKLTRINLFLIVNTQRNVMRFYPHALNIFSGNYDNMKYFRDGAQITAINLQKIGNARLLNDAVFMPPTSNFCLPDEIQNGICNNFLSYRLKPLWLIGLVPYPDLYNLEITLPNDDQFKFIYGLNKKEYLPTNRKIFIPDIDVTVPFFIVEKLGFQNGIEIVWSQSQLSGTLTFNIHKFNVQTTGIINRNEYNQVDLSNNCANDRLINYSQTETFTIEYTWTKSNSEENNKHKQLIKPYNDSIIDTRKDFKESTIELLNNINRLNKYQDTLFEIMNSKQSVIQRDDEEGENIELLE
jgi:hypothetical protein